jgi:alpha-beta hydrolase superfamily lysophospholipase
VELFTRHWPAQVSAWASALIIHGLAEHTGRYEHVGSHLAEAGVDAFAFDLRGFGRSGGSRAWVDRWGRFHEDMADRIVAIRAAGPGRPVFLYGHSLGGLLVTGYLLEDLDDGWGDRAGSGDSNDTPGRGTDNDAPGFLSGDGDGGSRPMPDAAVVSAPAIAATLPAAQRLAVNILGRVAPRLMVANRIPTATLSSIPAVREDYLADPLNVHRTTAGFGLLAFREQDRVLAGLDRIPVPMLVIHGGLDRLVPVESSEILAGHPNVTRRVYPGVAHELHNEPDADAVLAGVVDWLRHASGPGLPSSGPR